MGIFLREIPLRILSSCREGRCERRKKSFWVKYLELAVDRLVEGGVVVRAALHGLALDIAPDPDLLPASLVRGDDDHAPPDLRLHGDPPAAGALQNDSCSLQSQLLGVHNLQ